MLHYDYDRESCTYNVPSVFSCFRSLLHNATYLLPVDLKGKLQRGEYAQGLDARVDIIAKSILTQNEVTEIFSQSLNVNEMGSADRGGTLRRHRFSCLDGKCSVCRHPDLPQWIFKSGGEYTPGHSIARVQNDRHEIITYNQNDSLLRFEMAQRLRDAIARLDLELEVVIPEEYPICFNDDTSLKITERYCVLSKKLDVLCVADAVEALQGNKDLQRQYATTVIKLIEATGYSDASLYNIRLMSPENEGGQYRIAIVDTEPGGLLTIRGNKVFPRGESVQKHVRIGLYYLMTVAHKDRLGIIEEQAHKHYRAALRAESITKVALVVISCVIPLTLLVLTESYSNMFFQVLTKNQFYTLQISLGACTVFVPGTLWIFSIIKTLRIHIIVRKIKKTLDDSHGRLENEGVYQRENKWRSLAVSYYKAINGVQFGF